MEILLPKKEPDYRGYSFEIDPFPPRYDVNQLLDNLSIVSKHIWLQRERSAWLQLAQP